MKVAVGLLAGITLGICLSHAIASRNSSGTMSAINGPYVSGTTISSTVVNARLADIESELTDSLSRSGKGGATAPVRGADGSAAAPTYSFTADTDNGLYRIGTNNPAMSAGSTKVQDWTTAGSTLTGLFGIGGAATYPLDVTTKVGGVHARFGTLLTAEGDLPSLGFNALFDGSNWKYMTTAIAGNLGFDTTNYFIFYTSPSGTAGTTATMTERMRINTSGVTIANALTVTGATGLAAATVSTTLGVTGATTATGGITIGSSGTAISGSFRGTASWTPGNINAGTTTTTSVTVTGAASNADCIPGTPSNIALNLIFTCSITSSNTCTLTLANPTAGSVTGPSGTYTCRAFNP